MSEIIKKYGKITGKNKIFETRFACSPFLVGVTWHDFKTKNPLHTVCVNRERDTLILLDENVYAKIATDKFEDYLNNKYAVDDLKNEFFALEKDVREYYNNFYSCNPELKLLSIDELHKIIEKMDYFYKQIAEKTIYIENFDFDKILSVIGKEKIKALESIWERATESTFVSFEQRRSKFILDNIDDEDCFNKVKFIFTDYYWSKDNSEIAEHLSDYKKFRSKKEVDYREAVSQSEQKKEKYSIWLNTLQDEDRMVAEYMQWVMEMRDLRKDPIGQIQTILSEVSVELLKKINLDVECAQYILFYEYLRGSEYLISHYEEIKKRKFGCIYLSNPDFTFETELCDFDIAIKEAENLINEKNGFAEELRGHIACKGKVKGVVRVVLDPQNDKGFNSGDILVTSMTRPEYVPIMKKAGAVVTNEGDITCHAAIVSRELGIPCIIGTKNATRFLKDGDVVEVDAENGVVRIIN